MSLSPVHSRAIAPVWAAAPIGRAAVRALYAELALHPKPGLVSPLDSGSHQDMDMTTFMRSLFALRGYYRDIAAAGGAVRTSPRCKHWGSPPSVACWRPPAASTPTVAWYSGSACWPPPPDGCTGPAS